MGKYSVHECRNQPVGIRVEFSRDTFHEKFTWQVTFSREATEEDLENNHYLEEVGEVMWSLVAEITHCPYCGEKLMGSLSNNGEFVLFNSSGWSTKVL